MNKILSDYFNKQVQKKKLDRYFSIWLHWNSHKSKKIAIPFNLSLSEG